MPKTKSAAKQTAPKKQTKAAFVRSLPATTPAKDVVAKAKATGISLSENYVYNVRATSKISRRTGRASGSRSRKVGPSRTTASSEATFRRLVLDLGLSRAKNLLAEVEHKLDALVAGR
jgi:hypothetical protein